MAKIRATQTFLDDRDRFEEGQEYDVDTARAAYFVRNGWAESDSTIRGLGPAPQDVSLDIEGAAHTSTSNVKG